MQINKIRTAHCLLGLVQPLAIASLDNSNGYVAWHLGLAEFGNPWLAPLMLVGLSCIPAALCFSPCEAVLHP